MTGPGVGTPDDLLAVAAVHRLGLLRDGGWPEVATRLLVRGYGDLATAELAGGHLVPSQVDELVAAALPELDLPVLDEEAALAVLVRLVGQSAARPGSVRYAAVRRLASLSPTLDFPEALHDAAIAAEELGCGCGDCRGLGGDVPALEARLRAARPLDMDEELLLVLSGVGC